MIIVLTKMNQPQQQKSVALKHRLDCCHSPSQKMMMRVTPSR